MKSDSDDRRRLDRALFDLRCAVALLRIEGAEVAKRVDRDASEVAERHAPRIIPLPMRVVDGRS